MRETGYCRELAGGSGSDPSIYDSISNACAAEKENIVAYLNSGTVYAAAPMVVQDVFDSSVAIGSLYALTDGVWGWRSDLAYYVKNYNVCPPADFVDYMRRFQWKVAADALRI